MKKKKEQKFSGEKSERGKFSVQNWQSDPMNSPKAFGELKIMHVQKSILNIFLIRLWKTKCALELQN